MKRFLSLMILMLGVAVGHSQCPYSSHKAEVADKAEKSACTWKSSEKCEAKAGTFVAQSYFDQAEKTTKRSCSSYLNYLDQQNAVKARQAACFIAREKTLALQETLQNKEKV